ncbi:23S rRNA (adenine(2503)-C(2))-methyltransferase RlmN [bacterium]|nr:23S rRNA (adenine(2503)-C(2))-methyltransferase RlmN [candidate division CSSED10-310 bacterium]
MKAASLVDFSPDMLSEWCSSQNLDHFRASQIHEWIFKKLVFDYGSMTNLPAVLRTTLSKTVPVLNTVVKHVASDSDGTRKFVFSLTDDHSIETVFMPGDTGYTLCISSQVGCALGCRFCATGMMGIVRNLSAGEILSQILHARQQVQADDHGNIVFMGMGEPLLNADAVVDAVRRITDPHCMGWSPRRITLSTAGIIPEIRRLGKLNLLINLAVSLNAADEATRSRLMPINRKYPLKNLMAALKEYPLPSRQHQITYEYILINGINDDLQHAEKLVRLLDPRRDKVNLIPYNSVPGSRFKKSEPDVVERFQDRLRSGGLIAQIRKSRGNSIMAACGQLAGSIDAGRIHTETPPYRTCR